MKRLFILAIMIWAFGSAAGQGYHIELNLPGQENKSITLAYHYLDRIFSADTVRLDNNASGVLKGDSLLPQGLYKILIDKDHHFDFILGADQQFKLYNSTSDAKNMKIEGCAETQAYVDYIVFLDGIRQKGQELSEQLKAAQSNEKVKIEEEISQLTTQMKTRWSNIDEELPGSFLYRFLIANEVPQLDISSLAPEVQQSDSLLLLARFEYQKEHYWDNFDYTDERFLYTPFFKPKLETWFTKVLYPSYDSVKPYVYAFIEKVENQPRIFQFATSLFLNGSVNSNIMGMDALFVDLANDYYLNGKAFWANEETMKKIRENVLFAKDNLIGKIAPNLLMETFDGEFAELYQIDAELTVVLIYEPNCGHCKALVPPFYSDVYEKYKEKGLGVFAIYSMDNKQEWEDFINEHQLYNWINVWDQNNESRFKYLYDARVTPGVYLLDKNKKIIAKNLNLEAIKTFVAEKLD